MMLTNGKVRLQTFLFNLIQFASFSYSNTPITNQHHVPMIHLSQMLQSFLLIVLNFLVTRGGLSLWSYMSPSQSMVDIL